MQILEGNKIKDIVIVGDRVLIKPKSFNQKTESGLYLPPGVQQKEKVQSGYIVKVGPGYPLPISPDDGDDWKPSEDKIRYMPLQAEEGDLAIYLQNNAYEIEYAGEKYVIVPQSAILMLVRDQESLD